MNAGAGVNAEVWVRIKSWSQGYQQPQGGRRSRWMDWALKGFTEGQCSIRRIGIAGHFRHGPLAPSAPPPHAPGA